MFKRRDQCVNCGNSFYNVPKEIQTEMETECTHEIDQDTDDYCPIFSGTDEWNNIQELKTKCRNLIDGEYHNLKNSIRSGNDLYQYLGGSFKITEVIADELYDEIFPEYEGKQNDELDLPEPEIMSLEDMDTDFIIEEMVDMFNYSKERATEVLEACLKGAIMLKAARGKKHAFESFVKGYESDNDETFTVWRNMVETVDRDLSSIKGDIAMWEVDESFKRMINLIGKYN